MIFKKIKNIQIPAGATKKITANGVELWTQPLETATGILYNVLSSANVISEPSTTRTSIILDGLGYRLNRKFYWHDKSCLIFQFDDREEVMEIDPTWTASSSTRSMNVFGYTVTYQLQVNRKSMLYQFTFNFLTDACEYSRQLNVYYATPRQTDE